MQLTFFNLSPKSSAATCQVDAVQPSGGPGGALATAAARGLWRAVGEGGLTHRSSGRRALPAQGNAENIDLL